MMYLQRYLLIMCMMCYSRVIDCQNMLNVMQYKAINSAVVEGPAFDDVIDVVSSADCVRRCKNYSACNVISYSALAKKCAYYSWLNVTVVLTDNSPEKIWRHQELKLINTRNTSNTDLVHDDAAQLCEILGGRLTTVPEIYSIAAENVYDMCRCGWVTNQASIRLLVKNSSTCAEAKMDGVNVCKNMATAKHAYCTFE